MKTKYSYVRIGDYELLEKLGEGGAGAVYRARQVSLDRTVAVKLLRPSLAADQAFLERFQREARATARLNHEHVVSGISVGFDRGYHYFAMEYIEGESLDALLKRDGALREAEVVRLGAVVATALAHIHAAGLVHRDVKPANLMLTTNGAPKLTDLGLVKDREPVTAMLSRRGFSMGHTVYDNGGLTQEGAVLGTPHYISPEQASGEREIDGRADIYALGCTLYHAATGRTPFEDLPAPQLLVKHLTAPIPDARTLRPDLSERFVNLLKRMLERERDARIGRMEEVAYELHALSEAFQRSSSPRLAPRLDEAPAAGSSIRKFREWSVAKITRVRRKPRAAKPNRTAHLWAWLTVGASVLLAGLVAASWWLGRS